MAQTSARERIRALASLTDRLVPAEVTNDEERSLLAGTAFVLLQVSGFFVLLWVPWVLALPAVFPWVLLAPAVSLSGLFLVRRGRAHLAMGCGAAGAMIHWTVVAAADAGLASAAVVALALSIMLPASARDARGTLVAAVLAAVVVGGLATVPTGPPSVIVTVVTLATVASAVVATVFQLASFGGELRDTVHEGAEALAAARDEARAASEAKSAFLAAMSHEIRTPMNAVLGIAGLLAETPLSPKQRDQVETIRTAGNALIDIVDDILDFSRIEAGRLQLDAAPFEPMAIVKQVSDLLRVPAREKGLRLELDVGRRIPGRLVGDGGRLRQVLYNLVGNAVKYTEQGTVTLRLTCPERNPRKALLRVEVVDTGVGIAPEDLDRIFDRFTQVGASGLERRAAGTGLGLAITQHLIGLMGGELTVESEVGEGSTFRVDLRLATEATIVDVEEDIPALPAARILVAEDNPVNRKIALAMLDHLGCVGDVAANGAVAVQMASSTDYDLVLMDCEMPGVDGFEATRRLRTKKRRMPIVALTAHALPEVKRRCFDAGMDDFLDKPLDLDRLHRTLARWIVEQPSSSSAPPPPSVASVTPRATEGTN